LAKIRLSEGPNVISREAMSRRISIDASVHGRALSDVVADIKHGLEQVELPKDYFVVFGGQYQNQQRAMQSLAVATLMALVVVFMLLFLALGRVSDAMVILATLPDAFVGGILALLITGETLNVSSGVGFIALFGIAVQNGLVLLTQTRGLEAQGVSKEQAVRQASIARLRPKLMTASCAALGVVPILLSSGVGAEIEKPLAIVLVGGLITSTLFTLLVLPTVYILVERIRDRRTGKPSAIAQPGL
jgi:cobalt-zinc-cadmium resistance protein CzcA